MKIPEIKRLVTTYTLDALEKAELALIQEEAMPLKYMVKTTEKC